MNGNDCDGQKVSLDSTNVFKTGPETTRVEDPRTLMEFVIWMPIETQTLCDTRTHEPRKRKLPES